MPDEFQIDCNEVQKDLDRLRELSSSVAACEHEREYRTLLDMWGFRNKRALRDEIESLAAALAMVKERQRQTVKQLL
jgi:predicted RNA-binding protein Jag